MKIIRICCLCIINLFVLTSFQESSVQTEVFNALKNNDSKALVKNFNNTINLSIKGEDRVASQFQAGLLLADFFKINKITSIQLKSSGNIKQGSFYAVFSIQMDKEDLQALVKFMEIKGKPYIIEFKIY